MFPFDIEEEVVYETEEEQQDYEIDFSTGELTGRIITGKDAVVQWLRLQLAVNRYRYDQYDWDTGSEIEDIIGKGYSDDLAKSEIERMLKDICSMNDAIIGIAELVCSKNRDNLTASFTLKTIYGEERGICV